MSKADKRWGVDEILASSASGYLRLPLIAEILDLYCSASMYPSISTNDLLRIPFRKPSDAAVDAIKTMVDQSRAARTESRRLLDDAKKIVEKAVLEG